MWVRNNTANPQSYYFYCFVVAALVPVVFSKQRPNQPVRGSGAEVGMMMMMMLSDLVTVCRVERQISETGSAES
jgi:hypothetical protein